jgi:hypothetical protein
MKMILLIGLSLGVLCSGLHAKMCTIVVTVVNTQNSAYVAHSIEVRDIDFKNREENQAWQKQKKEILAALKAKYEVNGVKVRVKIHTIKPDWWYVLYTMNDKGLTKLYYAPISDKKRYQKSIDVSTWGDYVKKRGKKILSHGQGGAS